MFKRILFLIVFTTAIISCSSDDTTSTDNTGGSTNDPEVAMVTRIDGIIYETPPQNGGNSADASGGIYGNTYFLLKGYKNLGAGKALIGNKIYNIKVAIPKSDVTVGSHSFNSTIESGGYYADLDITGVSPTENVNTTSGSITVTSYNSTTKLLKGNFNFTTNDGVNTTNVSHTLIGSFSYILQ